jgi:hypothetical protein
MGFTKETDNEKRDSHCRCVRNGCVSKVEDRWSKGGGGETDSERQKKEEKR